MTIVNKMTNKKHMTIMASIPYESSSIMDRCSNGIEPLCQSTLTREALEERKVNLERLKLKEQLDETLETKEIESHKQKL